MSVDGGGCEGEDTLTLAEETRGRMLGGGPERRSRGWKERWGMPRLKCRHSPKGCRCMVGDVVEGGEGVAVSLRYEEEGSGIEIHPQPLLSHHLLLCHYPRPSKAVVLRYGEEEEGSGIHSLQLSHRAAGGLSIEPATNGGNGASKSEAVGGEGSSTVALPNDSLVVIFKAIVLPGEGITFQDMDIFHGHLVLFLHQKGIPVFCSVNLPVDVNIKQAIKIEDLNPWFFPVPSSLCSIVPGSNHDFMSSTYRVVISSPVMPDVMVDYNMEKQTFRIIHRDEVVGFTNNTQANSSSENLLSNLLSIQSHSNQHLQNVEDSHKWNDLSESFCCERGEVISYDGVLVPLTILYSRQAKNTGQSPGLLHGYGAYGEVLDKSWCSDHISLLSRGWVLAYADVRGGGGDASWHQAGTRSCKLNSIKDFAACGMYLVKEGFVHKNRLGAIGCSAGGLLVGAAINMYPDLFCAAILKVPFLDICNTMLDRSLPLTILDYDEFGDPRNQDDYEMIRSYSPYDNISPHVCYPSVLVTASIHDSRVGVWEAAKWVAKVRDNTCPTCSRSVILKSNMSGGHFAEGGRFIHCDDAAFEYAFLIKAMGLLQDEKQA